MATKQEIPQTPPPKGKPIFVGKSALVRLQNESDPNLSTIWLVDSSNKTIRPFVSEDKFETMFESPEQAHRAVVSLSSDELSEGGMLGDFHILGSDYGVGPDGSMKDVPFSPSQIQSRYGKPINEDGENRAVTALDSLVAGLGAQPPQGDPMAQMEASQPPEMGENAPEVAEGAGGPGTVSTDTTGMIYAKPDGQGGPGYDGKGGPGPDVTVPLAPGSTDTANVRKLQQWLVKMGYMSQADMDTGPGIYGPRTTAAVTKFKNIVGGEIDDNSPGSFTTDTISWINTATRMGLLTDNGIQTNGGNTAGSTGAVSNSSRYGKADNQVIDDFTSTQIKSNAAIGQTNAKGSLNPSFVQTLISDPTQMAFYINAMAYGGYSMGDIYKDMYRKQQAASNPSLANVAFISPTQDRTTYLATPEGQQANNIALTILPATDQMRTTNPAMFQYDVYNMPDSALGIGSSPLMTPGSPEWQTALDGIKADYYDTLTALATAQTDQEHSKALYDYNQVVADAEMKLGISLSDNATTAWKQLDGLEGMSGDNAFGKRGIQGSGMQAESVDDTLNKTRVQDQRNRIATLNLEEQKKASTMSSSGSASEIASLTPQQRADWGLTPSAEIANKFSIATIMANNPTFTQADAQAMHDAVIDENGNYRSTLYSKFYSDKLKNTRDAKAYKNQVLIQNMGLTDMQAKTKDQVVDPLSINQATKTDTPPPSTYVPPKTTTPTTTAPKVTTTPTTPVSTPAATYPMSSTVGKVTGVYAPGYTPPTTAPKATTPSTYGQVTGVYAPGYNPNSSTSGLSMNAPAAATKPLNIGAINGTYTVKSGDTLSSIYGSDWKNLSGYSGDPTKLQVGQVLKAPPSR